MPDNTDRPSPHALQSDEIASMQGVEPAIGLAEQEANRRIDLYGENRLTGKPPRSRWLSFLDQFRSLLILVLIAAAVLAGAIGDIKDTVVILVVVLVNALLGFWQEHRAEAALAALKKMLSPTSRVRRAGQQEQIAAARLVPGDIVLLEAGDRVPADGRLITTHSVEIDESALTGESHAVSKDASSRLAPEAPLAERINMAFMNTVLTRGRAEMLVTGTGMNTEMGRLAGLLDESEAGPTPLQLQLDALGRRLAVIAGFVIAVILALGLAKAEPLVEILLTSIALAVAAIPEGLPAVVTVTLALGMHRMAQHRAIVKKLAAVETLGCTTVICSDKTGTLTMNQMSARCAVIMGRRFAISGEGYGATGEISAEDGAEVPDLAPVLEPAILANESRIHAGELIGDPTEGALLVLAAKAGLDGDRLAMQNPRLAEIPFDSAYKFQATFHRHGDLVRICVKGAPDVLLGLSVRQYDALAEREFDKAFWLAENEHLASQAMRVLALATRSIPVEAFDPDGDLMACVEQLTFHGLVGIIDPPRPEAREAIQLCARAGIQVKMITGDHRITAAAIARELGLEGEVMEGKDLDGMSPDDLAERIRRVAVFARVSPEHKVRIVQALKASGQVTAMTGDGVNDAPALKNADIGIAMGIAGTEVTREAATMVLSDDNFATIVRAIHEGRAIYDNIVKFVRFQLSTNMGAIQAVLGASLLGLPAPFSAIQILWINIIMDGPPAMSLGVEPARAGLMEEAPRSRHGRILTMNRLARLFIYGLLMAAGTLFVFAYAKPEGEAYAQTLAFSTFVLFQFFNVFNARGERGSAFNRLFFRNSSLWLSLAAVLCLQAVAVHWTSAQEIFQTTDLAPGDWALAAAVASSVLLLDEAYKWGRRWFLRKPE